MTCAQQPCRAPAEAGFALAETLVAVAIIAVMMLVTAQMVAEDARMRSAMGQRRDAALLAQSLLARAVAGTAMNDQGRSGELRWRITERPDEGAETTSVGLDRLGVTVFGPSGQPLIKLATLRLSR